MRAQMSRSLLLIFGLMITLSSPRSLPAQIFPPYLGGGLRLGYVIGEGLSLGAEVTLGVLLPVGRNPIVGSISIGFQTNPTVPRVLTYKSVSAATPLSETLSLVGVAFGKTRYSSDGYNKYSGTRFILWGAQSLGFSNPFISALVSLESYRFPNLDTSKWSIGLWGKAALLLGDFFYT